MTINVAMNQLLAHQPNYASRPGLCTGLGCEDPLRVAAATLTHARSDDVTATTVVGVLDHDNAAALEALVADIAEEFGLDARVRMHVGSFSVRFSRQNGQ
jgi:hypothetical protein